VPGFVLHGIGKRGFRVDRGAEKEERPPAGDSEIQADGYLGFLCFFDGEEGSLVVGRFEQQAGGGEGCLEGIEDLVFGHVRFDDLEEYILNRLENELPGHLYYHNVKHTMDVCIGVEIIGTAEGVNEEELLYLKTAALFHDMGQIIQSNGHEEISCKYVREILPQYEYDDDQIDIICDIIMATQLPPNPQNKLQKIICDADLDYLGRADFIPVSDTLFKELCEQNIITDKNTWNKLQVNFISSHQYFTDFAKNNREVNKQNQIERLKSLITND